ncbi:MAG TPA: zf-HC2 domain-containing protein [Myxococcaceae bacterium]|nr:zf-HC2 domain-containing protein [Myxococcaceae bacterium]
MNVDCELLGALLSERGRGELSAEQDEALTVHLAGCSRCQEQAQALESVLARVELPAVSAAELEALRIRRVGESPPPAPLRRGWRFPAVLVAAAAAAVLTVSLRPAPNRRPDQVEVGTAESAELLPGVDSQELFPEFAADGADEPLDAAADDALSLEEPRLFENLDG